jgi:hypothetical protein
MLLAPMTTLLLLLLLVKLPCVLPLTAEAAAAAARPNAQQQLPELAVLCDMLPGENAVLAAMIHERCNLSPVNTCNTMHDSKQNQCKAGSNTSMCWQLNHTSDHHSPPHDASQ